MLSNAYCTLLSDRRLSTKTTIVTIPNYHGNSKERLHLEIPRKVLLKPSISSLLNTDLDNLNDSNLILKNDRLSIYSAIYIFLKLTCHISKKTKTYPAENKKQFFKTKDLACPAKRRLLSLPSKSILKPVIPNTKP